MFLEISVLCWGAAPPFNVPQHLIPVFLDNPGKGLSPRHHLTQNLCRDTAGRRLEFNWDHCIPLRGEVLTLKWNFFGIVRIVSIEEFVLGQRKRNTRGENAKSRRWKRVRIILSWFSEKWLQNFHSSGTFLKCLCRAVEKLENEQRALKNKSLLIWDSPSFPGDGFVSWMQLHILGEGSCAPYPVHIPVLPPAQPCCHSGSWN